MNQSKDFTIAKVSWHTKIIDNPETPEMVKKRFRVIVDFLQRNNLTVRMLLGPHEEPTDEFAIRCSDLTDEGVEVIKRGYDKWLKKVVNRSKDITDLTILEKALSELRGE